MAHLDFIQSHYLRVSKILEVEEICSHLKFTQCTHLNLNMLCKTMLVVTQVGFIFIHERNRKYKIYIYDYYMANFKDLGYKMTKFL